MLYLIIAENGGRHMASKVFEQYVVLKITSKWFIFSIVSFNHRLSLWRYKRKESGG